MCCFITYHEHKISLKHWSYLSIFQRSTGRHNISNLTWVIISSSSVLSDGVIQPLEAWLWWKAWVCQLGFIRNSLCITLGQYLSEPLLKTAEIHLLFRGNVECQSPGEDKWEMSVEMDGYVRPDLPALLLSLWWQGLEICIDIGGDEICEWGQISIRRHLCFLVIFGVR